MFQPPSISGTTSELVAVAPAPESPYIQPTFNYALRIWWAFYWPLNVVAGILTFGLMVLVYAMYHNVMVPAFVVKWATYAVPFLMNYGIAYFAMYYILGKTFRHFKIGLVSAGNFDRPQTVERTTNRVARVWFAYSWRALVYGLIATFVTSFPLGTLAGAFERIPLIAPTLRFIFQLAISGAVGLYVFYNNILDENFGDARVCLLRRDFETSLAPAQANAAVGPVVS
jgi:hypothetical protein